MCRRSFQMLDQQFLCPMSIPGLTSKAFENCFTRNNHKMNTRKNNKSVVIPRGRIDTGHKTFSIQEADIFYYLPNILQTKTSLLRFKASIKENIFFNFFLIRNFFKSFRILNFYFVNISLLDKGLWLIAVNYLLIILTCEKRKNL